MKEIIGMIHLKNDDVKLAVEEIEIYQEAGFSGVIVENYFGSIAAVEKTLAESQGKFNISIGVNVLGNYEKAVELTDKYNAEFIQVDTVAGKYTKGDFNQFERKDSVKLYGGVWPKYYIPIEGSNFEKDLLSGKEKTNAIVITGEGTGIETPLDKLLYARDILGDHPIIVGAGVNHDNAHDQLTIADGCIVGTSVKYQGKTENKVDSIRCKDLVDMIKEIK